MITEEEAISILLSTISVVNRSAGAQHRSPCLLTRPLNHVRSPFGCPVPQNNANNTVICSPEHDATGSRRRYCSGMLIPPLTDIGRTSLMGVLVPLPLIFETECRGTIEWNARNASSTHTKSVCHVRKSWLYVMPWPGQRLKYCTVGWVTDRTAPKISRARLTCLKMTLHD